MNINDLDEIKNEEGKQDYRVRIGKDISGKTLKMTLEMIQECKGKAYDLYQVCRVEDNGVGERKFIPLYKESFTPKQVEEFYNPPARGNRYTVAGKSDDEDLSLLDIIPGDFNIEDNLIDIY